MPHITRTVVALSATALCTNVFAGDPTPPPGPVAGTMKTLDDVEPRISINSDNTPGDADSLYHISDSGSYYLTGNVAGVIDKHGIEVSAPDVSIDLMGFSLTSGGGSTSGVFFEAAAVRGHVENGSIIGWDEAGVTFDAAACTAAALRINGGGFGIDSAATGVAVRACVVESAGSVGIRLNGSGALITDSRAALCSSTGISTGPGASIADCAAYSNIGGGISTGLGSSLLNCVANENSFTGIVVGIGGVARGCTASDSTISGFVLKEHATAIECASYSNNSQGFDASVAATIVNSTAADNGTEGINGEGRNLVVGCNVSESGNTGIFVEVNSVVRDSIITNSGAFGISLRGVSLAERNHVTGSGITSISTFNGINLVGGDNVLRENVIIGNDSGTNFGATDVDIDNVIQNNVPLP